MHCQRKMGGFQQTESPGKGEEFCESLGKLPENGAISEFFDAVSVVSGAVFGSRWCVYMPFFS